MKQTRDFPGEFRRYRTLAVAALSMLVLAGCTTERLTEPAQTATEQLLVSTAVDHAVGNLKPPIAPGSKVFVDAQFFDASDSNIVLPKYTIGAVRDLVLRSGGDLIDDRKAADLIVELRNGAQAINHHSLLIGIPSIPVPIPLAGTLTTPEIALFKRDQQRGISKIALTVYNAKTGALSGSTGPIFGDSQDIKWTVLLLIDWETGDAVPDTIENPPRQNPPGAP